MTKKINFRSETAHILVGGTVEKDGLFEVRIWNGVACLMTNICLGESVCLSHYHLLTLGR